MYLNFMQIECLLNALNDHFCFCGPQLVAHYVIAKTVVGFMQIQFSDLTGSVYAVLKR